MTRRSALSPGSPSAPFGMKGQNAGARRSRSAGRKVRADSTAKAMPIEAIGPSARLLARSLSSRQSRPAITVPPEAKIGSKAPRQAMSAASQRFAPVPDRFAETCGVEQGVVRGGTDHEDEKDALDLTVEHEDAGLGQPPHRQERDAQRERRGQQHEDRQQRRSVDDDEDDEHGAERDGEAESRRCRGTRPPDRR